jgi:hypothetical protein
MSFPMQFKASLVLLVVGICSWILSGCSTSSTETTDLSSSAALSSSQVQVDSLWLFLPPQISRDSTELANPLRGQYIWHGQNPVPWDWPAVDRYARFEWAQIEGQRGKFDWSAIDHELSLAKNAKARFGLRIMPMSQGWSGFRWKTYHTSLPGDFLDSVNPLIAKTPGDSATYAIPDWNHPHYMTRLRELLTALANRYGKDPHFAYLDISGYGNWGEFHLWPFSQKGGAYDTSVQRPMSQANIKQLIDLHAELFPNKILILNQEQVFATTYALELTQKNTALIGFRVDCLGSDNLAGGQYAMDRSPGGRDHWKKAPLFSEWCQYNLGTSGKNLFTQGLEQVRTFHFSTLSSGNFANDPSTPEEIAAFRAANAEAGYRISIDSIWVHRSPQQAQKVIIRAKWRNQNVAPTYLKWHVQWSLNSQANESPGSEKRSQFDLRQLLPGDGLWSSDTLEISNTESALKLYVQIQDSEGVSPPMHLSNLGRDSLGRYLLAEIPAP